MYASPPDLKGKRKDTQAHLRSTAQKNRHVGFASLYTSDPHYFFTPPFFLSPATFLSYSTNSALFLFPPSSRSLLLSHFLLSHAPVTLSSAALCILTFHLISHFALTIYSTLIISLFYPETPSFPDCFLDFFPSILSSPPLLLFTLFLPLPFPASCPPVLLCQPFSWCLTKYGVRIGKMPQNMACRQRHR